MERQVLGWEEWQWRVRCGDGDAWLADVAACACTGVARAVWRVWERARRSR